MSQRCTLLRTHPWGPVAWLRGVMSSWTASSWAAPGSVSAFELKACSSWWPSAQGWAKGQCTSLRNSPKEQAQLWSSPFRLSEATVKSASSWHVPPPAPLTSPSGLSQVSLSSNHWPLSQHPLPRNPNSDEHPKCTLPELQFCARHWATRLPAPLTFTIISILSTYCGLCTARVKRHGPSSQEIQPIGIRVSIWNENKPETVYNYAFDKIWDSSLSKNYTFMSIKNIIMPFGSFQ